MTGGSSTPQPPSSVSRDENGEAPEAARREETEEGGSRADSSSHEETEEAGSGADIGESITWRVRLSDNEPWKLRILFLVVLLAFVAGNVLVHSLLLGLLGSAMILAATSEFWLGTVYKLDEEGASSRTGLSYTRILWKDVKRAVVTPIGVKLSPLEETTRLAPFRGVFLRFGREDRVRIESHVRRLGGNDVRFVEGTAD